MTRDTIINLKGDKALKSALKKISLEEKTTISTLIYDILCNDNRVGSERLNILKKKIFQKK